MFKRIRFLELFTEGQLIKNSRMIDKNMINIDIIESVLLVHNKRINLLKTEWKLGNKITFLVQM